MEKIEKAKKAKTKLKLVQPESERERSWEIKPHPSRFRTPLTTPERRM